VIRVVELQSLQAGFGEIVEAQALVGLGHHGKPVGHGRRALEVLHNVTAAVGRCDVGLALEVVVGDVYLVGRQQVAQVDHARLGVRRVAAVRVAAGELGEFVERVAGGTWVALGHVQRQEAGQQAAVLIEGGQALEVVSVIDVRMLRMQADETLRRRARGFRLDVAVIGVDQFELRLLGEAAERIARLQCLEFADGAGVALVVQVGLCLLVQLDFTQILVDGFVG